MVVTRGPLGVLQTSNTRGPPVMWFQTAIYQIRQHVSMTWREHDIQHVSNDQINPNHDETDRKWKYFFRGWTRTSKISTDRHHANYRHHWGLYDTEVVQRIVYVNLKATWITWVAVP